MSRAKDTKIIGTSQKFFGITLVAGLLVGVVFFVVMFLLAIKEPSKQTAGATTPGQTQVVPHPQWYLTWRTMPGEKSGGDKVLEFPVTIERRDVILSIIWSRGAGTMAGFRQPNGSYKGTWKDSASRQGSFEELFFHPSGNATGWMIGTEGERIHLLLAQR
ncbi:MAG: hypothetical protein Q7K16_02240 [Candidatus Azambacteria bacterium]|nr:hypothetical protein [Candidatus Azambacteria bacterium]